MGIAQYPAASSSSSSPVKSIQRGSAASSGNVTISSIDITKAFVNIYGTASSGTVAASASVTGDAILGKANINWPLNGPSLQWSASFNTNGYWYASADPLTYESTSLQNRSRLVGAIVNSPAVTMNNVALNGGSNNRSEEHTSELQSH